MVFSVAGWIMEVTLKYIQFHRFINRGFLIGPYCPIYGTGAVIVTAVVHIIAGDDAGYFETFLISFVFCGALEYFVSWYMEKMFHARWWDYSERPMNLEGRIWIGNLILFGIGGLFIVKLIAPLLFREFDKLPDTLLYGLSIFIVVPIIADNIVSYIITSMVRKVGESSQGDSTEEISQEIRRILSQKSFFHRRILDAYPYMQARTKAIQKRISEEQRRLRQRIKEERRRFYTREK
ncbi:MAG: putative ABC transporter permease [Eubacteriales bacterium]|nr:putative ABC transporter permease [Eubacteriales bacterium]